jgi:large subunit ribosomal protein L3
MARRGQAQLLAEKRARPSSGVRDASRGKALLGKLTGVGGITVPIGLLGRKIGMTRVYDAAGTIIPVTIIEAGPCPILQVKNKDTDGYAAVQLGFDPAPERNVNRPMAGHFKRAGVAPVRLVREFRADDLDGYEVGKTLDLSLFQVGEQVDIVGRTKGRGFAGSIKKHHSHRGPTTHGSNYHRLPGSLGASADPSRVMKGKHMPGHYGDDRVTVQNITILDVDRERNLLVVRGSVPGHNNAYVTIRKSKKTARKAAGAKA